MHYIIESVFVGIYSVIIYLIIQIFFSNAYIQFFITGFLKHFLGYYLGLHKWYCNYGYACKNINNDNINNDNINKNNKFFDITNKPINNLTKESIIEGFLFLLVGTMITHFINSPIYIYFIIGFLLHIIFELLNIHIKYCINNCLNYIK